MSDGETEAEAIENARDAIVSWLRSARKHGDPIPPPNQTARYSGKFIVRMPPRLHASLSEKARYQGVSLNEYVTTVLAADVGGTKLAPSGSKVPDRNLSRNRQHGPKNKKAPAAR
jgi:antitoxin HicB